MAFTVSFSPTSPGTFSDSLTIANYTFSLSGSTPRGSSSLLPYAPSGWSAPVVVSDAAGTQVDSSTLTSTEPLYVSWAVKNVGDLSIDGSFYTDLLLDGHFLMRWASLNALPPNKFIDFEDYRIDPLAPGAHTLELVPDSTHSTLGLSEDYTKSFSIVQPPAVRLIATSLNPVTPRRVQRIDFGQPMQLVFGLGESFALKVVHVNIDGSDGLPVASIAGIKNQVQAKPTISSSLSSSDILFGKDVLLAFSAEPLNFAPVHSGTAILAMMVPTVLPGSVTFPVRIVSTGYRLGSPQTSFAQLCRKNGAQNNTFDSAILSYADLRGIPPQVVKGLVDKETTFNEAMFYRYEPLAFDFPYFSTSFYRTRKDPRDLRTSDTYKLYAVESFQDSTDVQPVHEGRGINEIDRAFRESYYITLDNKGVPLRSMSKGTGGATRKILRSDPPISMENIFYTGDSANQWTYFKPILAAGLIKYRMSGTPFTAQTVLAGSYGLTQATLMTALSFGYMTDGVVRPPSDLLDTDTNLDVGTEILAKSFESLFTSDSFPTVATFRTAWAKAFSVYNGTSSPGTISSYGSKAICLSDAYFPVQ
ncbi:MAG TPA: hypothetical protein VIE43_16345 [Thermoanaerobaculia bacterium]|jgi:hypothetical protein|nr:hypothetical protein [Thermoanaerobaculia bacterium]